MMVSHPTSYIKKDPGAIVIYSTGDSTHDNNVADAVSTGYGSSLATRILISVNPSVSDCLEMAKNHDIPIHISSVTGIADAEATALELYSHGLQLFMPLGSNSDIELATPDHLTVIVSCGAGTTENDTAYGNGLEFWDEDPTAATASSFANGVIAGKLLKIKEDLDCTWWEARYRARQTASNSVWDKFDGYGKIDVAAAIAWEGVVPEDPYL